MDLHMTGLITANALARALDLPHSEFCELFMKLFDGDNGVNINFENFIIACWSVLTIQEISMATFAFNILDHRGHGTLLQDEIALIIQAMVDMSPDQKLGVINLFKKLGDDEIGAITIDTFNKVANEIPLLLGPVHAYRRQLRQKLFGENRWTELVNIRHEKFGSSSLMAIVFCMRIRPTSYEYLLKTHGVDGSKQLTRKTECCDVITDISHLNPILYTERPISIFFHPVHSMGTGSVDIIVQERPFITKNLKKRKKRSKISQFRRYVRGISGCPDNNMSMSNLSRPRSRGMSVDSRRSAKVSPSGDSDHIRTKYDTKNDTNCTPQTATDGCCSSKEETMRALKEWSVTGSTVTSNKSHQASKSMRKEQILSLSRRAGSDSAMQRQEELDKIAVELIEASFWTPEFPKGRGRDSSKEKDRDTLNSSSSDGRCSTNRASLELYQ